MDGSRDRPRDRPAVRRPARSRQRPRRRTQLRAPGKLVVSERAVVQTAIAAGGPAPLRITPDLCARSSRYRVFWAADRRRGCGSRCASGSAPPMASRRRCRRSTSTRARSSSARAVANDKAKDALAAIREEYARFLTDGMTDEELDPLKSIYRRRTIANAPPGAVAGRGSAQPGAHDYPDDYLATYEQRLRGYSRSAVEADMRAAFPKALTAVLVAPSAEGLGADCVIKAPEEHRALRIGSSPRVLDNRAHALMRPFRPAKSRARFRPMHRYRTHTCGALREADIGQEVRLSGWCHRIRDHGGLLFIDLRDHYGLTQVVADPGFARLQAGREAALGVGGAHRRQGAQAPGRHRESGPADRRGRGLYPRDRGAGAGRRAADAGVRRPGVSRGDPAQVPLPRSAPRPAAPQHHDARRRSSTRSAGA